MAQITLQLKDANGNTIASHNLSTANVQQIDAINGAYYQFTDSATGTGPVRIDTTRSGDDLLVSFDNSNGTDLIIKDYFARGEGALIDDVVTKRREGEGTQPGETDRGRTALLVRLLHDAPITRRETLTSEPRALSA